ncbi:disease resistance At1g50180 [Olea europaea subsp. europaea]|uniref:Disease resistance At1g50180 n=1 Tax=Olea europaea subsp. europaea TaxID=158383 RepID=A0A8S0UJW8_OLEEU|nr:disease resistance At1g50180 [Olea europaea subsp. europaea]
MAEYVVTFFLEKIASYLIEEANSLSDIHDEVASIEGELRRMQCFLKDADSKQDANERVRNWVADIRDVAYDSEDVVEYYIFRLAQLRRKGFLPFFARYVFCHELILRRKVREQVKGIRIRLQDTTNSRSTYGIENIVEASQRAGFAAGSLQEKRRSSPYDCEEDVIGLAEDIKAVEAQLIYGESRLSVISIIGMAGIGKTTLTKKVYLSSDIKMHFDCCAWVFVSQEYRAKDILNELGKNLLGLRKADLEHRNSQDLLKTLSVFLEDKRYLIVLDDIWKTEVMNDLKEAFPEKNNGSRVLLTTRFKEVALYADPKCPPHELSLLKDEDSWKLFSRKVCVRIDSFASLPPWAEELGKQIVKTCGGLPLAIVVLGGLLSRKDATFIEWQKVLQSVHWQLRQDPAQCTEILALSYNDLPYYLKPCFLYFSLFPEDFEISARRLILLWVAEGFVQSRGQEPLEDIAEDYLEELIGRNMILAGKRKSDGRIRTCRMHDLLREFSISKAKEDHFLEVIHEDSSNSFLTGGRRVGIHFGVLPTSRSRNASKLRTLLCFDLNKTDIRNLKRYRLLHVLDLEGVYLPNLDCAVGDLIHLRYLGLRATWLRKLPISIRYLLNLQTLDLRSTLIDLVPFGIWKFRHLRNLYLNELKETVISPPKGPILANLQILRGIHIGSKSCVDGGLDKLTFIRELELRGALHLQEEAIAKWISSCKNLECLKLHDFPTFKNFDRPYISIPNMTFSGHCRLFKLHIGGFIKKLPDLEDFPPYLTELSLEGSLLMEDPMLKLEKLPNLRVLKLKQSSFVGKELICSRGGFTQLHFLKLSFLVVEKLRIEDGALSNLRQLEIIDCKQIKIVPNGLYPVTTLRDLKLGYISHGFELKVQDRRGENWYRIHQVPPI